MSEAVDKILRERRERGQLPTWYRRRDAVAEYISGMGERISARTLERARFVCDNGDPALREAMNARAISTAAAAELARLPADCQRQCLADPALRKRALRILREAEP